MGDAESTYNFPAVDAPDAVIINLCARSSIAGSL